MKHSRLLRRQLGAGGVNAKSQTSRVMFRTRDPEELLRELCGPNTWPGWGKKHLVWLGVMINMTSNGKLYHI